ncbi:MAG: formylglycine-generating enzyme family protein [Bacteriovoracales bacterium]|nr:formylglycine-generating enzyme family protein [Bacteriovoracales bacterium]
MFILVFFWALSVLPEAHGNGTKCKDLLQGRTEDEKKASTGNLIAYLKALTERRVIRREELFRLIHSLERGEMVSPISKERAQISRKALIHRKEIQRHLDEGKIDEKELLAWAKKALKKKERVRVERAEVEEDTREIYRKMKFHPVRGGRFQMGEAPSQRDVYLENGIEVMSTPVTQKQWVDIMGENPAHFTDGPDSITVDVKGKPIKMRPDHPVERVSFWSAILFANRLSVRHGLKPVFDLSEMRWKSGTQEEDGSLQAIGGRIKINAPGGNYYLAEGYRLPTGAEQEYMLRMGGKTKGEYAFGDNEADLKHYAWYWKNSKAQTRRVGGRKPIVVNGHKFYDLHGNVWEWGWDPRELKGLGFSRHFIRGGSWRNDAALLRSAFTNDLYPDYRADSIGFRLVRAILNP